MGTPYEDGKAAGAAHIACKPLVTADQWFAWGEVKRQAMAEALDRAEYLRGELDAIGLHLLEMRKDA